MWIKLQYEHTKFFVMKIIILGILKSQNYDNFYTHNIKGKTLMNPFATI
jgi:hypothetical protein